MTKLIRVLIADDHLIVREGLQLILETADELDWWAKRQTAHKPFSWLTNCSRM